MAAIITGTLNALIRGAYWLGGALDAFLRWFGKYLWRYRYKVICTFIFVSLGSLVIYGVLSILSSTSKMRTTFREKQQSEWVGTVRCYQTGKLYGEYQVRQKGRHLYDRKTGEWLTLPDEGCVKSLKRMK